MKTVPPQEFGKDHWSLLAYISTCYEGKLEPARLRDKTRRDWKPEYGTRLAGYFGKTIEENDKTKLLLDHDDFDCLDDLAAAGFIKDTMTRMGTGIVTFTHLGSVVDRMLRVHKEEGKHFSSFRFVQAIECR